MNCLLYARVSTDKQAQKELSIPAQIDAMKEYIEEGYQFFVIGSDLIFLAEYAKKNAEEAFAAKREYLSKKIGS